MEEGSAGATRDAHIMHDAQNTFLSARDAFLLTRCRFQVKEECIENLTEEKLSSAAAVDMLQLRLIAASQDVSVFSHHPCHVIHSQPTSMSRDPLATLQRCCSCVMQVSVLKSRAVAHEAEVSRMRRRLKFAEDDRQQVCSAHFTRHASRVTRHTSRVTRHTSHDTRHTSHVTRHTSRQLQKNIQALETDLHATQTQIKVGYTSPAASCPPSFASCCCCCCCFSHVNLGAGIQAGRRSAATSERGGDDDAHHRKRPHRWRAEGGA
jgi:hypothetical protein